jgi:hypothetical protein
MLRGLEIERLDEEITQMERKMREKVVHATLASKGLLRFVRNANKWDGQMITLYEKSLIEAIGGDAIRLPSEAAVW